MGCSLDLLWILVHPGKEDGRSVVGPDELINLFLVSRVLTLGFNPQRPFILHGIRTEPPISVPQPRIEP